MSFNQRGWIPSLLALAGVAIMIVYAYTSTLGADQKTLEAAKARWEANKLSDYQYIVQVTCFCPDEYTQPVQVRVQNGRFFNAEGSQKAVSENYIQQFGTVEALFGYLETAYQEGADEIVVDYDPTYGVPLRFSIDQIKEAVDDEMSLSVTEFQILSVSGE